MRQVTVRQARCEVVDKGKVAAILIEPFWQARQTNRNICFHCRGRYDDPSICAGCGLVPRVDGLTLRLGVG